MRPDVRRVLAAVALGLGLAGAGLLAGSGCGDWDPRAPFEHDAPEVDQALHELDAGRVLPAEDRLERYLKTGPCSADAGIALSTEIRQKPSGTFDLGLTLFSIGEQFGARFGDEEQDGGGGPHEQALAEKRGVEVGCALLVVRAIAADPAVPADLRARAGYLAGNLEFLRKKYEDAVEGVRPGARDRPWAPRRRRRRRHRARRGLEPGHRAAPDRGPEGRGKRRPRRERHPRRRGWQRRRRRIERAGRRRQGRRRARRR